MASAAASLFANDAFYQAFRTRDLAAMDALWAQHHRVACIHPGWSALTSRAEVMESWQGIFSNPQAPQVAERSASAFLLGEEAFVVCYEVVGQSVLAATNIFVREEGTWRMVHHHAGACTLAPGDLEAEEENPALQ